MKTRIVGAAVGGAMVLSIVVMATSVTNTQASENDILRQEFMSARVPYKCVGANDLIDQLVGGPRRQKIGMSGRFPRVVESGAKVPVNNFRVKSRINKQMVRKYVVDWKFKRVRLNRKYSVRPSTAKVWLNLRSGRKAYRATARIRNGAWRQPRLGHGLTMPARGRVKVRALDPDARLIRVYLPKKVALIERWDPPLLGSVKRAPFRCSVLKSVTASDRLLGKIKVR